MHDGGAGGVGGEAFSRRWSNQARDIAASFDVWASFARDRGLAPRRGSEAAGPDITGELDGVPCGLAVVLDDSGWAFTRAIAAPVAQVACKVEVRPRGASIFGFLQTLLTRAPDLGSSLPGNFTIRSKPAHFAPSLLAPPLAGLLAAFAAREQLMELVYAPPAVRVVWSGVELDPDVLQAALDLVVAAARWEPRGAPYR